MTTTTGCATRFILLCLLLAASGFAWSARAEEAVPEVEEQEEVEGDIADPYDLFDPVPKALMRPMITDRPTFVSSPRTLDAGHFQFETALVEYEKDVTAGGTSETYLINQINLKLGLNLDADAQVIVQSYKIVNTNGLQRGGFGDITLRFKFNLFGNDRGLLAGAVIPSLKLPVSSQFGNGMFEGGLLFPLEWIPSENWSVVLMAGPEFLKNTANNNFHVDAVGGLAVSTILSQDYIPFVEYFCRYNGETRAYQANVGGGMSYVLGSGWRVDGGGSFGLNANSTDMRFYLGLSLRA